MNINPDYATDAWYNALRDDLHRAGRDSTDSSHDAADAIAEILRGLATCQLFNTSESETLTRAADTLESQLGNAS